MALKRLTTAEMVQITGPWIEATSKAKTALLGKPLLAALVPQIEAAHAALHGAQGTPDDPKLETLKGEAATLDQKHDTIIRGVHMVLSGLALLAANEDAANKILAVRDFLLPDGLSAIQGTYRAEAGAAELLATRLAADASTAGALKDIPVHGKSVNDFVESWIATARELGKNEDARAQLAPSAGPSDGAKLVEARNLWIRTVNGVVAMGQLAGLDADADRLIFSPLRDAEKTADRRIKAPADAPGTPPTTGPGI